MSRFYLRLILIPIAFFTAVLLIIRIQPYDDHELRQLLLPEGCPAPCFMGIRPGITTMDEALVLLEKSGWITKTDIQSFSNNIGVIYFNWNNQTPKWIIGNMQGELMLTDKIVTTISIRTIFSLGETRILLGLPDMEAVDTSLVDATNNKRIISYYARYDKIGSLIAASVHCDSDKLKLLPKAVSIIFTAPVGLAPIKFSSLNNISQACND